MKCESTSTSQEYRRETEEGGLTDETENEQQDEPESPSSLPCNKNKYVMNINHSKLARKPYYNQIKKNKFENEYCLLMDAKVKVSDRYIILYQLVATMKMKRDNDYKEGMEILSYLKIEANQKEEAILPLKNEILYLLEQMDGNS